MYTTPNNIEFSTITSIDSLITYPQTPYNYRVFHINAYDSILHQYFSASPWIEGIGSSAGLFYQLYNPVLYNNQALYCFSDSIGEKCNCETYLNFFVGECSFYTGIANSSLPQQCIKIYPNPTSDLLNITYETNEPIIEILVSDISGRVIQMQKTSFINSTGAINIASLANGLYFLQLKSDERVVAVQKFAKE